MRMIFVAALAALGVLHAGTALAADCQLHLFDAAQMTRLPDGRDTIPVMVNGSRQDFLFDTGGARTQLSRKLADDLKLHIHSGDGYLLDIAGERSDFVAAVDDLIIAHMRGTDQELPISPVKGLDGIVGLDHFTKLDLDMDFGNDQVKFFSPDHCDGQVVYWTDPNSVGIVPMKNVNSFHIRIPVTLDGHTTNAIIDTGAVRTIFKLNEAGWHFDLKPGDADMPPLKGQNGKPIPNAFTHHFGNLSFGDVTVKNPEVLITPAVMADDMIIGMDVLRKLHIYVAFKEGRIYVSPASAHITATAAPSTSPPASAAEH